MPLDEHSETRRERAEDDPMALLEASECAQHIHALLAELTPSQQEVLRLRFQENLSYKEISAVTRHSVSHVGVLIHEGLKNLKRKMGATAPPRLMEGGRSHA